MTIQELYSRIEGDYEQATRVMKADKLIDKYVRKLKNSNVNQALAEAGESLDPVKLFESAHAMKGVCSNLGLVKLAAAAGEITEEFRPGNPRQLTDEAVKEKLAAIDRLYKMTVETIQKYEEGV